MLVEDGNVVEEKHGVDKIMENKANGKMSKKKKNILT